MLALPAFPFRVAPRFAAVVLAAGCGTSGDPRLWLEEDADGGAGQALRKPGEKAPRGVGSHDGFNDGKLLRVDITKVRVTDETLVEGNGDLASLTAACDSLFGNPLGEVWYAFNDNECYAGTSQSLLQLLHNGRDGRGCSIRWLGQLDRRAGFTAFAGTGFDITRRDLDTVKALHFEVRGDGGEYRIQLPTRGQIEEGRRARGEQPTREDGTTDCHEEWFDFYGQVFTCGDGSDRWAPMDVDLAAIVQSGTGNAVARDLFEMKQLQIVTTEKTPSPFQCEVRLIAVE